MDGPVKSRSWHEPKDMSTDDMVVCYELATRLRRHEPPHDLDSALGKWLDRAREELAARNELQRVREYLPVYYDPARQTPVYGPGATLVSQAAIERAIAPGQPIRQIAAS